LSIFTCGGTEHVRIRHSTYPGKYSVLSSVVHDSWGLRLDRSRSTRLRPRLLPPPQSPHCAQRAPHPPPRAARPPPAPARAQSLGRAWDGDTRRRGLARRRARRRRARTSHRSGCPRALPCPETQPGRPQHQHRCARQAAGIVASTFILGTGEGRATLGAWV
jgi:hypothetical protein